MKIRPPAVKAPIGIASPSELRLGVMDWMVSNPVVAGIRIFALPDVNAKPGGSVSFKEVAARFVGEELVTSRLNVIGVPGATTGRSTDFVTSSKENVWTDVEQSPEQV